MSESIISADSSKIITHLDFLCNKIGVRVAGTPEESAAGNYAAEVFRSYGANVNVENYPIGQRVVERQHLEVKIADKWIEFPCSLLGASPGTGGETVSAPLVFFESEVDYQRPDLSYLTGKAVVHFGTHIESRESYQRLMAAAPAFLMFVDLRFPGTTPTADGLFPAYVADIGARPTVSIAYFDAWNWAKIDAAEARLTVSGGTQDGISLNVIAEFPGTDPEAGIIYTGSHLDTQSDTVGADDNASGMAWQLELARVLAPLKLKRTVRHIAFGTEEQLSVG
ncbi:MAG: M28 family peptidase, partial [Victivallales bacterium]|nr:M28 family peptidase [Victivallales bacterium]